VGVTVIIAATRPHAPAWQEWPALTSAPIARPGPQNT
jgi:hypothetical protein